MECKAEDMTEWKVVIYFCIFYVYSMSLSQKKHVSMSFLRHRFKYSAYILLKDNENRNHNDSVLRTFSIIPMKKSNNCDTH